MKSKDVQNQTGLTRKAIQYYEAQGLLCPSRDENGYRHYGEHDVSTLSRIKAYRTLGLSLADIQSISLSGNKKQAIADLVREKTIRHRMDEKRLHLLAQVAVSDRLEAIQEELLALEAQETIYDKLSHQFPGYIGQMLFLHYAPFLKGRLETAEQKQAFDELVNFLDQMEELPFTKEETAAIQHAAEDLSVEKIEAIRESSVRAVWDMEKWMVQNEASIQQYQEIKGSAAYQSAQVVQLFEKMKRFLRTSGYYERVIPLIRQMSPAYDRYYRQLLQANEQFISQFGGGDRPTDRRGSQGK